MKKIALIFDHDGTLVDSMEAVLLCTNKILNGAGCESIYMDELKKGMAFPTFERFHYHSRLEDPDLLKTMCRDFYMTMNKIGVDSVKLYPRIKENLDLLSSRGYSLGMLTNNQGYFARRAAARLRYAYNFELILGEENVPVPKPDPRGLLQACAGLGSDPKSCWYIGDGKPDFEVARAAGLKSALVSWGAHPREELVALKADVLFDSPDEMGDFFQ